MTYKYTTNELAMHNYYEYIYNNALITHYKICEN